MVACISSRGIALRCVLLAACYQAHCDKSKNQGTDSIFTCKDADIFSIISGDAFEC